MKLKNIVLVLLLSPLLVVGCRSPRPAAVISNPDIFPPDFKYSEIQDKTLEVAESGDVSTAQFFVQNYVANIYPTSGTPDRNLVLQKIRSNSRQNISIIEKALASRGYQKVAPEEANCVISICYGEGNRDGRVGQRGVISRYKIGFLEVSCDLPKEGSENAHAWQVMAQIGKKKGLETVFEPLVGVVAKNVPISSEEVAREKRQHSFFF